MKSLVIGYGSIGKRHADVLAGLGHDVAIVSRRAVDHPRRFAAIPPAIEAFAPDYVVVASRTNEHMDDINTLARSGFNGLLLIEKPVYDKGAAKPPAVFSRTKVAFNLRFHPALLRFREIIRGRRVHAVDAYVGSYLPNWRPDSDYRQGYSAIRAEGGGVLRDLSHELDHLTWTFGGWQRLAAICGQFSTLEIDSDDVIAVLFETDRVPCLTLQMNYLDTTTRRTVNALTDAGSVRLDLVAGTVESGDGIETFSIERNDTYRDQHQAMIAGHDDVICDIDEGLDVMRMIDAIEAAGKSATWIRR